MIPQGIGEDGSNQGGDTADDDIWENRTAHNVADEAADEQARDCSGGKYREYGQSLRNAELNLTEADGCKDDCEHHIDGSDHSCLCHE